MLLLIDLDGTLINTVHPTWKPYKDGQENYSIEPYLAQLPVFPGSKEFIESRRCRGDRIVIVSDSHTRYVKPICNMFGVEFLSLVDKPNTSKFKQYLESHPDYKRDVDNGDCYVIGDTKLDIEFGRHIGAMTIWLMLYKVTDELKDVRDGIGDDMLIKKMGPTFVAKSFNELELIIDYPLSNLYAVESVFADSSSVQSIRLNENRYADGTFSIIRCLARQEQGECDKFSRADKYYMLSNPQRTQDFLQKIASGVSGFINQPSVANMQWNYFTYLTDKTTTTPPLKMKEIFDKVESNITKIQLLKWAENTQGSLRQQNQYADRQMFLQKYLHVEDIDIGGKNIIVLDDQITTSATAWHVIRKLKEKGAKNVMFIALFHMILPVNTDVACPRCGKPMIVKLRRSDGHRFYSCTPSQYGGDGCGYTISID